MSGDLAIVERFWQPIKGRGPRLTRVRQGDWRVWAFSPCPLDIGRMVTVTRDFGLWWVNGVFPTHPTAEASGDE